jgi:hypothetical protein
MGRIGRIHACDHVDRQQRHQRRHDLPVDPLRNKRRQRSRGRVAEQGRPVGIMVFEIGGDRPGIWDDARSVDQDRHLVLAAESERGLVADGDRTERNVQPLMRQGQARAPGELAVSQPVPSREFVEDHRHRD